MSRPIRRLYSSTTHPPATQIAAQFLTQAHSTPPRTRTQHLDLNQLQLLASTLDRPLPLPLPTSHANAHGAGIPLPPAWHLAYFTSPQPYASLAPDGTDASYSPPAPFTRRMWAGGAVSWAATGNRLRVGQSVTETTRVLSAEGKRSRAGEEMVVVGVEKVLSNGFGEAVVDRRNWIFRHALTPAVVAPPPPLPRPAMVPFAPVPLSSRTRSYLQTAVSLFRFSALTFNGHRIHYDAEWCRSVEGHRGLVVHGPLNLVNMLDFWGDVVGAGEGQGSWPKRIEYRATGPLYADEGYRIVAAEEKQGEAADGGKGRWTEIRVEDGFGNLSMWGRVER